jgi:uncharacterized protein (DUF433 family)
MNALGHGVYDICEAARLTGLRRERVREWFRGRISDPIPRPVFRSDYEGSTGGHSISFLDLVEVFVAGQLRVHGVPLKSLRRTHARLRKEWKTKHPFSRKDIRDNGKDTFVGTLDGPEREAVEGVVSKSRVFEDIILPALEKMEYDRATDLAVKWHLSPLVVLDPRVCFGKPVVEPVGITTYVLAASYLAHGQDARAVADWYEIEAEHVMAAVEFEARHAA